MTDPSLEPELLEKEPGRIREMFGEIAERYDLTNAFLTCGIDSLWRHRAAVLFARELRRRMDVNQIPSHGRLLDGCSGTGKFGRRLHRMMPESDRVVCVDFCLPFLQEGKKKNILQEDLVPVTGDLTKMPIRTDTFAGGVIGFGYRNVQSRQRALRELNRILVPGGVLAILEFQFPRMPVFSDLFRLYFNHLLPALGNQLAGVDTQAYQYLKESVNRFPDAGTLKQEFKNSPLSLLYHHANPLGITHLFLLEAGEAP